MRRKLLGTQLTMLREAIGLTYDQVATAIGASRPKVLRHEQGITPVRKDDLEQLMALYQVTDKAQQARLENLRLQGLMKSYPDAFGPSVPYHLRDLADAESMATGFRIWEIGVVPGIFQTAEYTEATVHMVTSIATTGQDDPDELAKVREERKQVVVKDTPPEIFAVIGEAALRTLVGGPKVLRNQIEYLMELSLRPNISLQVMPFSAGQNAGTSGPFELLSFESGASDQAFYIEAARLLDDEQQMLADKRRRMDLLIAQALSPDESRTLMRQISATL